MTGPRLVQRSIRLELTGSSEFAYGELGPSTPWDEITNALDCAKSEGYNAFCISSSEHPSGEALELFERARSLGFSTTLECPARMLVSSARVDRRILQLNSVQADSCSQSLPQLDGLLDEHRRRGQSFGLSLMLGRDNLDDLPAAAWFAAQQRAACLTVQVANHVERSRTVLSSEQRVWAMLVLAHAHQRHPQVKYEIDLSHVETVRRDPASIFALPETLKVREQPLATLATPLVIAANGNLLPLLKGLGPRFGLGNLKDAPFPRLVETWKHERAESFAKFCRQVHADICQNSALPFFNWGEHLMLHTRRLSAVVPRAEPEGPALARRDLAEISAGLACARGMLIHSRTGLRSAGIPTN
ncbi:MAG TPA: hypothetical protein VHM70_21840 [Polyangiaceae bacterium]|jgi:hypothetical protein|nr:hypothetical protein [Polyangiaceae bacterium]